MSEKRLQKTFRGAAVRLDYSLEFVRLVQHDSAYNGAQHSGADYCQADSAGIFFVSLENKNICNFPEN